MKYVITKFVQETPIAAALFGVAMMVAVSTPASAQTQAAGGAAASSDASAIGIGLGGGAVVDDATLEKRKEIEEAYKRTVKNQPSAAAATNDPWANMRGPEEQKAAAKPAAKTAHTAPKKKPAQ